MKKKFNLLIVFILLISLTGCTKYLKNEEKQIVRNEVTGQSITENIICQPTHKSMIKIYEENKIDIKNLPKCEKFSPVGHYEGLWTSLFVKPLAWVIIQIGKLLHNYGLAVIVSCILIRLILYPFTKKTAMQSEILKEAKPELDRLEKKYENKTSQEDQQKKAQEMMLIYQKYKINPISGCLLAFIQLPLLIAFYEAINRTPAIFEGKLFGLSLGTTPWVGIAHGKYYYIILVILIFVTTYFSFKKTMKDQSGSMANMKYSLYFMLAIITYASFTMSTAIGMYWVTSSLFTIIQNKLVERKKETR